MGIKYRLIQLARILKLASRFSCFINQDGSVDPVEDFRHAEFCINKLIDSGDLDERYRPKKSENDELENFADYSLRNKAIEKYCEKTGAIRVSGDSFYANKISSNELKNIRHFIMGFGKSYPYKEVTIQEAPFSSGRNVKIAVLPDMNDENPRALIFIDNPNELWKKPTNFGRGGFFTSPTEVEKYKNS